MPQRTNVCPAARLRPFQAMPVETHFVAWLLRCRPVAPALPGRRAQQDMRGVQRPRPRCRPQL